MIVFNLKCGNDHSFEGWFGSAADFEQQRQSTLLNCPVCGDNNVSKALHAPHVGSGGTSSSERARQGHDGEKQYTNAAREAVRVLEHLIANTEDVGDTFPEEARRIHYKEAPERQIRGNATRDEVKELREEGIEVIALPVPKYRLGKSH